MPCPEQCGGGGAVFDRLITGHEGVLVVPVLCSRVSIAPGSQSDGSGDDREAKEL